MTRTTPAFLAALALTSCRGEAPPPPAAPPPPTPVLDRAQLAVFAPLPAAMDSQENPATPERVALGHLLYVDPRFSKNHDLSCNSCHDLARYGVDGQPFSTGHKGQKGGRNAPTVYNAALHLAQFWDGRARDVEEQAMGPVVNPVEMAMADGDRVVKVIRAVPAYVEAFARAFPGEKEVITFENFAKAIAAFERTLVTPSRFDRYLGGDDAALTHGEKAGLATFLRTGCATCHNGAGLGGGMYQKAGLVKPWPGADPGRSQVTGNEADRSFFKVPSLRNVEKTGPYFHDASAATLEEAVALMADRQLGKQLASQEVQSIVTFLHALTGELPPAALAVPELPPAGPGLPPADPS